MSATNGRLSLSQRHWGMARPYKTSPLLLAQTMLVNCAFTFCVYYKKDLSDIGRRGLCCRTLLKKMILTTTDTDGRSDGRPYRATLSSNHSPPFSPLTLRFGGFGGRFLAGFRASVLLRKKKFSFYTSNICNFRFLSLLLQSKYIINLRRETQKSSTPLIIRAEMSATVAN